MLQIILGWIGWRFVPDIVSRILLNYFHRFYSTVLRRPVPQPGTPLYVTHRRYLYALVVFCYMVYTFQKTASSIGPNYYELLGVSPAADDAALKAGFRAFARKYHPDRAGPQAEGLFMEVRDAYEALKDPVTRFAYDRFGPSALTWRNCSTMDEYITHGLYQSAAVYIVGFCALLFWNKIAPRDLAFWNYTLLMGTLAYELLFIFSPSVSDPSNSTLSSLIFTDPIAPSSSGWFGFMWPSRVAYQHIIFLKSLSLLLSSSLYQVLPNIFHSNPETLPAPQLSNLLGMLNTTVRNIDAEAYTMINTDIHACSGADYGSNTTNATFLTQPAKPPEDVMATIDTEIEHMLLEGSLQSQAGPIQSLIEQLHRRRKAEKAKDAPSGGVAGRRKPLHRTPSRRETGRASVMPARSLEGYLRGRSRSCDT